MIGMQKSFPDATDPTPIWCIDFSDAVVLLAKQVLARRILSLEKCTRILDLDTNILRRDMKFEFDFFALWYCEFASLLDQLSFGLWMG